MDDICDKGRNMGLGKLGTVTFQRAFRWTCHPEHHDDASWWIQKIHVDYKNKTLDIEAFYDSDGTVSNWIDDLYIEGKDNKLTVNHYDGCGKVLSRVEYAGLEIVEHVLDYDYSNSNVLTHMMKLSFRRVKHTHKLNVH